MRTTSPPTPEPPAARPSAPTLSVLITYYNERELLAECLSSLAAQAHPPDEIIVYDDASTYPAADYLPPGLTVRVIRGETNVGPARGRNCLLAEARGDVVHFHDADDLFAPSWCAQVRGALAADHVDVVLTEIRSVAGDELRGERVLGLARLAADPDLLRFCLRGFLLVPSGTYRRDLVGALGGYRETLWQAEDFDFHVRLAARGVSYHVIDEPLVTIRLRPDGRSARRGEVWTSALRAVTLHAQELPAPYHQDLAEMTAHIGSQLFKHGCRRSAHEAFRLAHRLGPPRFHAQRRPYRLLARGLGPRAAEWLSLLYRRTLPGFLRRGIAGLG